MRIWADHGHYLGNAGRSDDEEDRQAGAMPAVVWGRGWHGWQWASSLARWPLLSRLPHGVVSDANARRAPRLVLCLSLALGNNQDELCLGAIVSAVI